MTHSTTVWRVYDERYAEDALTGKASSRFGGRWNLAGTRVVYCAASVALATLELLVHVEDTQELKAINWLAAGMTIPDHAIEIPARLPDSWRAYPYAPDTQRFGSDWANAGRSVALRVPSAVIASEFNYVLNTEHRQFSKLKLAAPHPLEFDRRLLQ